MADKKTYTINAEVKDVEIRKVVDVVVPITDKKSGEVKEYHHLELSCDVGENCDRIYLKDKNMENINKYKRGMVGTFFIRIDVEEDFGSKAKFTVTNFKEDSDK